MKKILWTSLFWLLIVVGFWAYIRFFNNDLGSKLSYCLMPTTTETGTVDYGEDIILINEQLSDIQEKMEDILQTLGEQTLTEKELELENRPAPDLEELTGDVLDK